MNQVLKNFEKKKQVERNLVRNVVIRTVKSKINLQENVKKNVNHDENVIEAFFIDLRKNNQAGVFCSQISHVLRFS